MIPATLVESHELNQHDINYAFCARTLPYSGTAFPKRAGTGTCVYFKLRFVDAKQGRLCIVQPAPMLAART